MNYGDLPPHTDKVWIQWIYMQIVMVSIDDNVIKLISGSTDTDSIATEKSGITATENFT